MVGRRIVYIKIGWDWRGNETAENVLFTTAIEELTREGDVGVKNTKYSLAGLMRSVTCTISQ